MTEVSALEYSARLLGLFALIQTYEFHRLKFPLSQVWRWQDLEEELGRPFRIVLSENAFLVLNLFCGLVALDAIIHPHAGSILILFVLHILTLLRWRGTYNGGSDYMGLMLLGFAGLGLWRQGTMAKVCLYYMAFQLCLSYFKAGLVKLKSAEWQAGRALSDFISSPIYEKKPWLENLMARNPLGLAACWSVMLYELTFPIAVFNQSLAFVYLICGCGFHLVNTYVFGLNRFFFAWVAAYPALLYVAGSF